MLWIATLAIPLGVLVTELPENLAQGTRRNPGLPTDPSTSDWGAQWVGLGISTVLVLGLAVAGGLLLGPFGRGYGIRLPRVPRTPRFVAATAWAFLVLGATGLLHPLIGTTLFSLDPGRGTVDFDAIPFGNRVMIAINAGVSEESLQIALPAGSVYAIMMAVSWLRQQFGRTALRDCTIWLSAAIVGPLVLLPLRFSGHLYQGVDAAISGLIWGVGMIVVFAWARSIWPLVLAHTLYDMPTAGFGWPMAITYYIVVPLIIAVAVPLVARSWRRVGSHRPDGNDS